MKEADNEAALSRFVRSDGKTLQTIKASERPAPDRVASGARFPGIRLGELWCACTHNNSTHKHDVDT